MKYESDDYINCDWCSWYSYQRIGTMSGGLGNNGTGGDCPNYSIVEIGEESWRLEVTCCYSNSSGKPSANADVKNLKKKKKNMQPEYGNELLN